MIHAMINNGKTTKITNSRKMLPISSILKITIMNNITTSRVMQRRIYLAILNIFKRNCKEMVIINKEG